MGTNGIWTVIQKRTGGAVTFDREWAAYKNGFGFASWDHWLGLEKISAMTKDKSKRWKLRVDLWDFEGGSAYAEYEDFRVGDESTNYRLSVGRYSGTAGTYASLHEEHRKNILIYFLNTKTSKLKFLPFPHHICRAYHDGHLYAF
uniref:Fibrinogen C-terminal domain-containing protein n=1 Tax=Oryzias sinensis TaxID=183150 RepID=A0A8C7Y722_9TELE